MIKKGDRILAQHVNAVIPQRKAGGQLIPNGLPPGKYMVAVGDIAWTLLRFGEVRRVSLYHQYTWRPSELFFEPAISGFVYKSSSVRSSYIVADGADKTKMVCVAGIAVVKILCPDGTTANEMRGAWPMRYENEAMLIFAAYGSMQVLWASSETYITDGRKWKWAVVRWSGV